MKQRIRMLGVLLIAAVLLAGSWAAWSYSQFLQQPLSLPTNGKVIIIHPGDTTGEVLLRLEQQGVTHYDWHWRLLLRLQPSLVQSGEFSLDPPLLPEQLLVLLSSGHTVQHRFTLVEGWTYRQLVRALQADPMLKTDPKNLAASRIMESIGHEHAHPEGWFLPETYAFVRGESAVDLLRRAHLAMHQALEEAWHQRALDLPLDDPYQLLTLASIVEKESSVVDELAQISGVFVRRLKENWKLETDPTVIYGMGENYDGNIRRRDLSADTPYNTYIHRGLPPTPIAMPGRRTLHAAANPAPGTAMFFVADGYGGHVFSDSLDEHNQAVQSYLKVLRDNKNQTAN